jgi:TetR/AcrR family transcriptional regulator, transcriptional repressor for nem operon
MARPPEFDRRKAVHAAMRTIWRNGYEAASVKHLSETLGITRSSFYNAFGTREDLFREALADYLVLLPNLPDTGKPGKAILPQLTGFFRALCAFHAKTGWHGCLIANCVAELCAPTGELDEELTLCVRRSVESLRSIIDAAKSSGELPENRDSYEIALALQNLMMGLSALAKAVRDEQTIWRMTKTTLTGLGLYSAPQ